MMKMKKKKKEYRNRRTSKYQSSSISGRIQTKYSYPLPSQLVMKIKAN